MARPPLSLYVHLPWCERKCPYCDFNSHERQDIPEAVYIDSLLEDLAAETHAEQRSLATVFIGGGTPSLFSVDAIDRLLQGIREHADLAPQAEITLEANPGSVESTRLAGYARAGVNRFSLGIQSFNDRSLGALGRVHDGGQARAAVTAAHGSGARSFNLDLMHGLPQQSPEQGLDDLRQAIDGDAPHLSWYQLTIEPNTRFYTAPPLLPVENDLATLEERGGALLKEAGYTRYEVSAWAKPGEECRHNRNYWEFGDYLAVGAGAHGKITAADGRITRYAKTRGPEDYMASGGTRRVGQRMLDADDRRGEFMLNALRLTRGFDLDLFEERTGIDAAAIMERLCRLEDKGLLVLDSGRVRASDRGLRFLDDVVGVFFEA